MKSMNLQFSGPLILCGDEGVSLFGADVSRRAGLYLWTVSTGAGFLVEYVGETGVSFSQRMKDHMIQCLGGYYRIWDASLLKQGRRELVWGGLWKKDRLGDMPEFVRRYVELAPKIIEYLATLRLFVAPIDTTAAIRRRIEGAVAESLRTQSPPIGSFFQDGIRYVHRKPDENPITVSMECSSTILGLPSELSA